MLKIGIFNDDGFDAAAELLQSIVDGVPIEICRDMRQPLDILIVNRVPFGSSTNSEHISPKIIIANSDDKQVLQYVSSLEAQVITYGLNPKAAVTVSSHADDIYVICIQRAMLTIFDAPIMPREFSVSIEWCKGFDDIIVGIVTTALICGVNFE